MGHIRILQDNLLATQAEMHT